MLLPHSSAPNAKADSLGGQILGCPANVLEGHDSHSKGSSTTNVQPPARAPNPTPRALRSQPGSQLEMMLLSSCFKSTTIAWCALQTSS